ncbi:MAG: response regulator [Halanaerobium sp.]|nr:response regulator [Halanaerobium sp.]
MARVLVVDDAKFMRVTLKNLLEEGGHEVVGEAANGVEAIEKFQELQPDIVTMDITMPEMDGIEATKKILRENPQANIIVCSAMGQKAMVVEAIQAGAKDFVVKPIKADKMQGALAKLT